MTTAAVAPSVGDAAPDCRVELFDGRVVSLGELADAPLLLVFLRHLA